MIYTKINGTGRAVPKRILSNEDLTHIVETSDEWIVSRTGIENRHISTGEQTVDLAEKAALKALSRSSVDPSDIDMVIVATVTPDHAFPGVANLLQKRLQLREVPTFDINAACSGFLYTLHLADTLIKSGAYTHILIIGAETLTRLTDWSDRNTCVLFGDGAGAMIISKSRKNHIIDSLLGSRSDDAGHLMCDSPALKDPLKNHVSQQDHIHMNGSEVFKFATRVMPTTIQSLLQRNEIDSSVVNHVIAHQANKRIIEKASKSVGIPMDKMFMNIQNYGNTSAASVPIAIDEAIELGVLKPGDLFITVAFGGGFTYGGALIRL